VSPAEGNRELPAPAGPLALETSIELDIPQQLVTNSSANGCDTRGTAISHPSLTHGQHSLVDFQSDWHWRLYSKLQGAFANSLKGELNVSTSTGKYLSTQNAIESLETYDPL